MSRKIVLALVVVVAFVVGAAYCELQVTAYDQQGHALYKARNYAAAAEAYGRAISWAYLCPSDTLAEMYCDRGDAYDLAGQLDLALADYAEAIRRDPKVSRFWFERGIAYKGAKRYAEARADFDKAISLHTGRPTYYFERGATLFMLADYTAAIPDFDHYIDAPREQPVLYGRDYRAYDLRGWSKYKLGDNKGALADFERALKIKPDYAQAWQDEQVVYTAMGETALAKEAGEKAKAAKRP